jgi:hypothetical protein
MQIVFRRSSLALYMRACVYFCLQPATLLSSLLHDGNILPKSYRIKGRFVYLLTNLSKWENSKDDSIFSLGQR